MSLTRVATAEGAGLTGTPATLTMTSSGSRPARWLALPTVTSGTRTPGLYTCFATPTVFTCGVCIQVHFDQHKYIMKVDRLPQAQPVGFHFAKVDPPGSTYLI